MRSRAQLSFLALLVGATVVACSSRTATTTPSNSSAPTSSATTLSGSITVFAAASLKEAFNKIAADFEAAHPGTKVTFSYAASSALAAQIKSGAPADVFAAASPATMTLVTAAGLASGVREFAKNTMEIAVPPTNPAGVMTLADLGRSGVKVALCQPQVPCGSTALKVFVKARIKVIPATLEPDVKAVLTKVELNEVDAGVVYVTDVLAAGQKVHGVAIPSSVNAVTKYPIAALGHSSNATLAQAFVAFVLSATGQATLQAAGFAAP